MSTDTDTFDQPPLRNRLNFYAKRLRPAGHSFLRIPKREAAELSALLTEAEGEIKKLQGDIDAFMADQAGTA